MRKLFKGGNYMRKYGNLCNLQALASSGRLELLGNSPKIKMLSLVVQSCPGVVGFNLLFHKAS